MSFLDTIKDLFFGKTVETSAVEQHNEVTTEPEVKPEPAPPVSSPVLKKEKTTEPQIPEDSTLRRHYLANQEAEKQPKTVKTVAPVKKVAATTVVTKSIKTNEEPVATLQIPQDATLRRHFISALKNKIETTLPARPTDSTLKRHYDAIVQAKLDQLLA